jgi:hypothetical protein
LLLADSPKGEQNRNVSTCSSSKGESYIVHCIVTFMKRLISISFQSFHHHLVDWTKPSNTSLVLGTITDLSRSKSELVAENALLRQQLIILSRQVKRPACVKTDRMLLVLLARMVQAWKQAHITRSARDAPPLASPGIQALLEIQVQRNLCQTKDLPRDHILNQGDSKQQSTVGSRTSTGRITQAGSSRQQADYSEVHEIRAHCKARRTEVEHLLAHAC